MEGNLMAALLPAWLIGAPLVLAIFSLMKTPKETGGPPTYRGEPIRS